LPADVFNGLTALEELDLSNNQLSELPENIFNGLTALRNLDLDNNRLSNDQVQAIRAALQGRNINLRVGDQQVAPMVDDNSPSQASSSTATSTSMTVLPGPKQLQELMSQQGQKRSRDQCNDQNSDGDQVNNGKRQK